MKIFPIIIILLILTGTKSKTYISLEHVGDSDKSIFTIIISKDSVKSSDSLYDYRPYLYIIRERYYDTIKKIIIKHLDTTKLTDLQLGTYKISLNDGASNISFFLSRKKSLLLFNDLIRSTQNSEEYNDLLLGLKETLKRFSY